jgi:hypothetical protein
MDEIIKTITEKTGISDEQARQAAQATVDYIKSKIPPMFATQLDRLLEGGGSSSGGGSGFLGGIFGS